MSPFDSQRSVAALPEHRGRLLRVAPLTLLLAVCCTGCMTYPYHNQIFPDRGSTVSFAGYIPEPNAAVQIYVQSWPQGDCASGGPTEWELLGTTYSSGSPLIDNNGNPWYQFNYYKVIPNKNWCLVPASPGGGLGGLSYKTHVYARYMKNGKWWEIVTFEEQDYVDCWDAHDGNGYAMAIECSRVNEPDGHAVAIWAEKN